MTRRTANWKILGVFLLCAIAVVLVTWTLSEKFIPNPRIALLANLGVALGIAFIFSRYLENRLFHSVEFLRSKIASVEAGDLTQRFSEDPADPLPFGLSFQLNEMMKSLRQSVGGVRSMSMDFSRRMLSFVDASKAALAELHTETTAFGQIAQNLETARGHAGQTSRKMGEIRTTLQEESENIKALQAATSSHSQHDDENASGLKGILGTLESLREIVGKKSEEPFWHLEEIAGRLSQAGKQLGELTVSSDLVRLNTGIDASRAQSENENYATLVGEVQNLNEDIKRISKQSENAFAFATVQSAQARDKLKENEKEITHTTALIAQIERRVGSCQGLGAEARLRTQNMARKLREIRELAEASTRQAEEFALALKEATHQFDKLRSDVQITQLKFSEMGEQTERFRKQLARMDAINQKITIG